MLQVSMSSLTTPWVKRLSSWPPTAGTPTSPRCWSAPGRTPTAAVTAGTRPLMGRVSPDRGRSSQRYSKREEIWIHRIVGDKRRCEYYKLFWLLCCCIGFFPIIALVMSAVLRICFWSLRVETAAESDIKKFVLKWKFVKGKRFLLRRVVLLF